MLSLFRDIPSIRANSPISVNTSGLEKNLRETIENGNVDNVFLIHLESLLSSLYH